MRPRTTLRFNDAIFVNEYMLNGWNATRAYQKAHPHCTYQTARRASSKTMEKPLVRAEIARRIQNIGVITRESLESDLVKYKTWAEEKGDYQAASDIVMDCAKLGGFLVEKREDVTERVPQLTDEQLWSELESRLLEHKMSDNVKSVKPEPSTQKSHSVPSESRHDAP